MTKSLITKKPICGSATSIADLLGPPPVILGEDARKLGAGDRFFLATRQHERRRAADPGRLTINTMGGAWPRPGIIIRRRKRRPHAAEEWLFINIGGGTAFPDRRH